MAENYLSPELNAKVKKNLLRFFMFTVVMIFAGLTSAYIVSMGDYFWVKATLPKAFIWSTTCILFSSLFLIVAIRSIKQNKYGIVKVSLAFSLLLGLAFGYFQLIGWGELFDKGERFNSPIINQKGQYGKYFSFSYEGKEITYENNTYYLRGEEISDEVATEMKSMCKELLEGSLSGNGQYHLTNYGTGLMLKRDGIPITYTNDKLQLNGQDFDHALDLELRYFCDSYLSGRGAFYLIGEYDKDFAIYYKGDKLDYKNGTFYRKGKKLSAVQLDRLNSQQNSSGSFIFVFTLVHLLHWLGGAIALIVMFIKGLRLRYSADNYLGMTLGSTYWHFLGILWLYLYLFLIFIH